jgi:hypothetical protein
MEISQGRRGPVPEALTCGRRELVYVVSVRRVVFSFAAWVLIAAFGVALVVTPFLPGLHWLMRIAFSINCLVIGLPALLCVPIGIAETARDAFLKVLLRPDGVSWRCVTGWKNCTWSDVESVWNQNDHAHYGGRTDEFFVGYEICATDGRRVRLNWHIVGVCELGRTIERLTYPHIVARLERAYSSGEWIDFGRIQISSQGCRKFGHVCPWEEIEAVSIDGHTVVFQIRNQPWPHWIGQSPTKVKNLAALIGLSSRFGKPVRAALPFSVE